MIQPIETSDVMENIQNGKHIVCVNFRDEQYLDCKTMTIQTLQEKMEDGDCLFFVTE